MKQVLSVPTEMKVNDKLVVFKTPVIVIRKTSEYITVQNKDLGKEWTLTHSAFTMWNMTCTYPLTVERMY